MAAVATLVARSTLHRAWRRPCMLRHDVYHEKIVCENAAFPALVGKYFFPVFSAAFQQAIPPQCCKAHGTDAIARSADRSRYH